MVIIDKCGVRGDATLCVVIFSSTIFRGDIFSLFQIVRENSEK